MNNALDASTGQMVCAAQAGKRYSWVCPLCGKKVYRATGSIIPTHFRHWPNEGSEACELYTGKPKHYDTFPYIPPTWDEHLIALANDFQGKTTDNQAERWPVLISISENEFNIYVDNFVQRLDINLIAGKDHFSQMNSTESYVSRILDSHGFLLGVYDDFCDAYIQKTRAKIGETIVLAGPVQNIERQAANLRDKFRWLNRDLAPAVYYSRAGKFQNRQLSGLPADWSLLTAHLAEGIDITHLDWIEIYPYVVRGGWEWRNKNFLPTGPPTVSRAKNAKGEWRVLRNNESVENLNLFTDELPLTAFSSPGLYTIWLNSEDVSLIFSIENPPWNIGEWPEEEIPEGGWYWNGGWPSMTPVPDAPRLYGAHVEGDFVDTADHSSANTALSASTLEMTWLHKQANLPPVRNRYSLAFGSPAATYLYRGRNP